MALQKATFGAGCFWHVEEKFACTPGVKTTAAGFMGGTTKRPTYEEVGTGQTGHAEVVQVVFDSRKVSYEELLRLFWEMHDPTTPDRQGPDVGSQYRSVIFFHSKVQERKARGLKAALEAEKKFSRPMVTQIAPASVFWRAEEYHQRYLQKHGGAACPV